MAKTASKSKKVSPRRVQKKAAKGKQKLKPKKEYPVAIGFEVGKPKGENHA